MHTASPNKILRKPQVLERVSVSSTTLWRMERRGEFPAHIKISAGAVGYLESDVESWIRARAEARKKNETGARVGSRSRRQIPTLE